MKVSCEALFVFFLFILFLDTNERIGKKGRGLKTKVYSVDCTPKERQKTRERERCAQSKQRQRGYMDRSRKSKQKQINYPPMQ